MFSATGYQLYSEEGEYWTFEYYGPEEYEGKEYFKYLCTNLLTYILAPTRNITKVTFPFDGYYWGNGDMGMMPLSYVCLYSLYGFTSVPENKILMKPRTDIGTNANNKAYVDLGLTSGTLWATMNVGATSETDYGSYFQWGDTVDKRDADCSWESYKYGDGSNFSKYNTGFENTGGTIDNKTILDPEDDAARANMGGDWKMPSIALIEELVAETDSEWVTNYNGSGISGRKFTSRTDESKYIFIPASGYRFNSSFEIQDSFGFIWSSSLRISGPIDAWYLYFTSSNVVASNDIYNRCSGMTVRGVL